MTGFFFVVDPVWWIGTIHLSSVWIGIGTGIIVWFGIWYRDHLKKKIQIQQKERYVYNAIDPNMDNYAGLTLIEIRKYLAYIHPPQHSWAHIPSQIATYITDPRLMHIIGQLEEAEYAENELTGEEKKEINRELNIKMRPQDKKMQKQ